METTATTKLRTILLVGILSISMLSAGIGSVGAAPAHSSIGSVSVDDRSAAGSTPAPPADPDEWDLRSSKHSGTMSAEIIIDEETVRGITITDDVNSEGRDVSIAKDALSGWIDEIPDQVEGVHEDGDRWSSEVRISADRVIVYVPEFSTQTIMFSSQVSITADPADSGAIFEYDVTNRSISDVSVDLTGHDNQKYNNITGSGLSNGDTVDLDFGGNAPLSGPSDGDPLLSVTGKAAGSDNLDELGKSSATGSPRLFYISDDGSSKNPGEFTLINPPNNIDRVELSMASYIGDISKTTVDIYAVNGEKSDGVYKEGTKVKDSWTPEQSNGLLTIPLDHNTSSGSNVTIEVVPQTNTGGNMGPTMSTASASDPLISYDGSTSDAVADALALQSPKNIDITASDGTNHYVGDINDSESLSTKFDVSRSATTLSVDADAGAVDLDLTAKETTETVDPELTVSSDIGNQTIGYVGSLSDGQTADISNQLNKSKLGGNVSVSVSVSDAVSSGPIGQVDLAYVHDADQQKKISYSGEEFSERYSISHTWTHDRASADIVIPWASDRVVDVRSVSVDGQDTSQYSAANGELRVDLGSVQSGDKTNVTAVGSKVAVSGGSITVDDPTTQGEDLDSGISIDSLSESTLTIDVSESYHVDERDRLIYIPDTTADWSGADPITRIEPGSQTVEINPSSSSSFRLRSAAVGSSIESGDAVLRMEDSSIPKVSVSEGQTAGDTLKLTYHNTQPGDYYRVVDANGNAIDTDRAESPAEFRISDTVGLFSIESFIPDAVVGGISSGAAAVSSGGSLIPPWLALIATLSASIIGLAYVGTRTEIGSSMLGRRLIIGGGVILGYVGAELVTGERLYRLALDGVSGFIGSALGAGAGAGSGAISGLADIGFISLVLGIGLLVGLYAIDQRTGLDIPRAGWGIAAGLISVWVISQLGIGTGVSIGGQQSLSIVLGIGLVLGLLALDQRGILSIPLPLYAGAALLVGVYVLETLAPGSVLGPLQSGLDQVGPLIWLGILGGSLLLLWVWLRSNRPQIQILGRGGQQ